MDKQKKMLEQLLEYVVDEYLTEGYYRIDPGKPPAIKEVIRQWIKGNKAYDDRPHAWYPIEEVLPYREYKWSREKARRSPEEWDELKQKIKNEGFDPENPIIVLVGKNGKAKIGEGNHRLAIAHELGLERVPVMFMFYQNVD